MEKREFKKTIREIGFSSQKSFAENIGVKATTFTTYKNIPNHIVRIVNMGLMAKRNGISFEEIKEAMKID
ncbi:hypothetical protein [Arcobacter sp. YIC-80]|uniref:hypothetical protein n=1 Tax=unclassified Arcobacter TaxID=2593671 RepID=UPI00384AB6EB